MTLPPRPPRHILSLDHGTSGCKVALVSVEGEVRDWAFEPVPTTYLPHGGAEQDPEHWWRAFVAAARAVLSHADVPRDSVVAVAVSSTLSSTMAVGHNGEPLLPCLTWLDSRAARYVPDYVGGFPTLQGYNARKLWHWVRLASGIPQLSGKDDLAHVWLVQREHPDVYNRTHLFLGSKDWLNARLTGNFAASYDSVSLFWLTDIRDINNVHYDDSLIRLAGIDRRLLPPLLPSTAVLGTLRPEVAEELGLSDRVQVVVGAADHQSALVGSAAVRDYEGHCYIGTSSWIECLVPFKRTDILHSIASLASAIPGRYQCIDEQDIAGGALAFVAQTLLKHDRRLPGPNEDPYPVLDTIAAAAPAGSHGVLFAPWLNGERTPVDSTTLRGMFYNLSLSTTLEDMIRAVYEGVAFNTRWNLGYVEKFAGRGRGPRPFDALTFIGGGARSDLWCQIFADILNRPVRQAVSPMCANARGAAFLAAIGLGHLRLADIPPLARHSRTFEPNPQHRALYDDLYAHFLRLYRNNRRALALLNRPG